MKPKKLIREKIKEKLQPEEYEQVTDLVELNTLYALKIKEELLEIQSSDHKDIMEFVDLMDVVLAFAEQNGFPIEKLMVKGLIKNVEKGSFSNVVLTNMNPNNPSNKLYFENPIPKLLIIEVPNDSYGHFINNVGCLRYYVMHGTLEQSSSICPEDIGEYLETSRHELVGHIFVDKQKFILYKHK